MKKRWFSAIGGGALALLLLTPSTSSAQVLFGLGFPFGGFGLYGGWGGYGPFGPWGGRVMGPVGYNYYIPQTPSVTYNTTVPLYSGLMPVNNNNSFFRTSINNPAFNPQGGYAMNNPFYYSSPSATVVSGGLRPLSNNISNVAFAQSRNPDQRASISVRVPSIATVWIGDEMTRETGRDRLFHSPPLDPDKRYLYTVRARWTDPDGKEHNQKTTVRVSAGNTSRVAFPLMDEESKTDTPKKEVKPKPDTKNTGKEGEAKPSRGPAKEGEAKPKKDNSKGSDSKDKE